MYNHLVKTVYKVLICQRFISLTINLCRQQDDNIELRYSYNVFYKRKLAVCKHVSDKGIEIMVGSVEMMILTINKISRGILNAKFIIFKAIEKLSNLSVDLKKKSHATPDKVRQVHCIIINNSCFIYIHLTIRRNIHH